MIQFNEKLEVTDHDLSQMANSWAKLLPNEDIGIRTAFAHGFKAALREVKKLNKSFVSGSVCEHDMSHFIHKDSVCSKCGFVDKGSHEQTVR